MQCLLMREPFERVAVEVVGLQVTISMARWQQMVSLTENYDSDEEARERYEEIKMFCSVDYGFHLFMES